MSEGRAPAEGAVPGPFRTLVLGANGNVGTLLIRELARRGAPVTGALRPHRPRPNEPAGVAWVAVDLENPDSLRAALSGIDGVIWTPSVGLVPRCLPMLEAAKPRRVVIVSSASVHTRLPSSGARTKRSAEEAIRASSLDYTIVRPTMIYGNGRDRNVARLLDYLERFPLFPLFGDGSGMMQPVFIDDLAEVILRALVSPRAKGKTYDVGGAAPLSYRALVETAAAALGRRVHFAQVPLGLAAGSLRWANRMGLRFLREEQVHRLTEDKVVDNGLVLADLGVQPRSFAEGISVQVRVRG